MRSKVRKISFEGQDIYIGLDVHKKSWTASFCTAHTNQQTVLIEKPFVDNLLKYCNKHYPGGNYHCAYEAGFSGFWAQEQLEKKGVKTRVVHPADIPTSDKQRQFKDDPGDSRKISDGLRNKQLDGIYIPDKISQMDRSVVRERYSVAKTQRRVKNQIKSHLLFYGIEIPQEMDSRYWSRRFVSWLQTISEQKKDEALGLKIDRHLLLRQLQLKATRKLRAMTKDKRYVQLSEILLSVPGVGLLTTMLLISEIIDMKRFKSQDQLFAYVGFIPTRNTSGDKVVIGEMTRRGNSKLKSALIESSWVAIRQDPELLIKYENYRKRMGGHKAIVRIGRILLRRIRRLWLKREKYLKAQA